MLNLSSPFPNPVSWHCKLPIHVWFGIRDLGGESMWLIQILVQLVVSPPSVTGALSGAVNNYWHCHYRPSLNSLRLFRVAGIYRVRPRWAGGVTNVSEMNVFCDRRRYRCLALFCFGSSRGAPQRRRQMASVGGGAPSPVPTQWLPAGLAASGPGLNV